MLKLAGAFLATLIMIPMPALAQKAVRLKGIGYDMSVSERMEAARKLGLDCFTGGDEVVFEGQRATVMAPGLDSYFSCFFPGKYEFSSDTPGKVWTIKMANTHMIKFRVIPSYTQLHFTCQILNACNVTMEELGRAILEAGHVQDYGLDAPKGSTPYAHMCGRAAAGEIVCVFAPWPNNYGEYSKGPHVGIFPGSFGSGPISLD